MSMFTVESLEAPAVNSGDFELTLPAGKYFVGDPCYVIEDSDLWSKFCDKYFDYSEEHVSTVSGAVINGHMVVASGTALGDGFYEDESGNGYSVDAGLIGLTPEALLKDFNNFEEICEKAEGLGQWVDFDSEVTISYSEGLISISSDSIEISISTGD